MGHDICRFCLKNPAQLLDHFFPRSLGGGNGDNLLPSCKKCNARKSGHVFWSLRAARDFICDSKKGYVDWLRDYIRQHVSPDSAPWVEMAIDGRMENHPDACPFCFGQVAPMERRRGWPKKFCSRGCKVAHNNLESLLRRKWRHTREAASTVSYPPKQSAGQSA